eukprot:1175746-Prorocentrum_minimum.AAC.3
MPFSHYTCTHLSFVICDVRRARISLAAAPDRGGGRQQPIINNTLKTCTVEPSETNTTLKQATVSIHLREWSCWRYRLKTPNTGRKPATRSPPHGVIRGSALCSEENSGPGIRLRNLFVERGG